MKFRDFSLNFSDESHSFLIQRKISQVFMLLASSKSVLEISASDEPNRFVDFFRIERKVANLDSRSISYNLILSGSVCA